MTEELDDLDEFYNIIFDPIRESIKKELATRRAAIIRNIAEDIVGVQPMKAPAGLVLTLRTRYSGGGNGR